MRQPNDSKEERSVLALPSSARADVSDGEEHKFAALGCREIFCSSYGKAHTVLACKVGVTE